MLKRIPVSQVRLGMFLESLEGPWINHPFWKTRFLVKDEADLRKLQQSSVAYVMVDVVKGADVAPAAGAAAVAVAERPQPKPPAAPPPVRRSLLEELSQAAAICHRGRTQMTTMFMAARMGRAIDAEHCLPLVHDISESVFRNPSALVSLARLKTKDDYSYMHSVAVCALMVSLGRSLGLDADRCREAGLAGLLHDLGKMGVPQDVLNKPTKLTPEEFDLIKTHPERGYQMLQEGRGVGEPVLDVCLHHHERMDGRGYPHGMAGEDIAPITRMAAICDVYDAITSNRPYKAGWEPAESIAQMMSWKGHFDPQVLHAFIAGLGIYPIGSLVRLQSERLGVVVEQNAEELISPVVRVFYSLRAQMPVTPERLDLRRSSDRIVARESARKLGFAHIDEMWAGDAAPKRR